MALFLQALSRQVGDAGEPAEIKNAGLLKVVKEAMVIDQDGKNLGVLPTSKAWAKAAELGMELVKVRDASGESPAVLKITSGGDSRQEDKPRKKKLTGDALHDRPKEIRISDKITEHDLQVKMDKATQHLCSRYRVRILLSFKRRQEYDPELAKAVLDNVTTRLADITIVETPMKMLDDRACFVLLKPISRKQLLAKGLIELPSTDAAKEPSRREITAAKRRAAELEREELRAQGLLVKEFLSPAEQKSMALQGGGKTPQSRPPPGPRRVVQQQDEEQDLEGEDDEQWDEDGDLDDDDFVEPGSKTSGR